jgi:serine/threonine protein phosphatase 1
MSTFAISDVHGRRHELELLMAYIDCSTADTLVFLGDYIDRGPDSRGVIEKLIELETVMPDVHFLRGNHEDMAIAARVDDEVRNFWIKHGGDKTLESYPYGIPIAHWRFIERLNNYIEMDESIFVHACLDGELAMECQQDEVLIWKKLRKPIHHFSGKKIYCGHSMQRSGYPAIKGSARCIECSGWLTAINVDTDHVFQVNAVSCKRNFAIPA